MIGRKSIQQLSNLIVKSILEDINSKLNTSLEFLFLISFIQLFESFQLKPKRLWILLVNFGQIRQTLFRLSIKLLQLTTRLTKSPFEIVSGPLNCVFDLVWEVF